MVRHLNWIPNALTLLRLVLIVPFAMALYEGEYRLALIVFGVAALTDGVDGFLARAFDWGSRLGAIADPLADKALLITAYLMLTLTSVIPSWLFVLILARDAVIVLGALAFHVFIGRFDMAPSIPGKLNTLTQVLVVLSIIMLMAGLPMHDWVLSWGIWAVAAMAVLSGGHYVVVWATRAYKAKS